MPSLIEIGLLVLGKMFFKYLEYFYSFAIISPWARAFPLV
jgi:hypothetical protein